MTPFDPPKKPELVYWTPKRVGLAALVALFVVGLTATAMAAPGLDGLKESLPGSRGCDEAAEHHYRAALAGGGEEAFYAGLAAQQLKALGADCPIPDGA